MFSSAFLLTPSTCRPCCGGLWALSTQLEPRTVTGDRGCVGVLAAGPAVHIPELCLLSLLSLLLTLYKALIQQSVLEPVTDSGSDWPPPWLRFMIPPPTTMTNKPHDLAVLKSNTFRKHLSPPMAGTSFPENSTKTCTVFVGPVYSASELLHFHYL